MEPCLPSAAKAPPAGPGWIYEIKRDGFRIMAYRDTAGIRLIMRKGNDFARRFEHYEGDVRSYQTRLKARLRGHPV